MHRRIITALALMVAAIAVLFTFPAHAEMMNLSGKIGSKYKIRMSLDVSGAHATGTYYYESQGEEIRLTGTKTGGKNLALNEYDAKGNVTGHFIGTIETDNSFQGTWTSADGKRSYPFNLLPLDYPRHPGAQVRSHSYRGTIRGDLDIRMSLTARLRDEGRYAEVSGTYYYVKHREQIKVKGHFGEDGFYLEEFDSKGSMTGVFRGNWTGKRKISGTWSKPDGSRSFAFELHEQ